MDNANTQRLQSIRERLTRSAHAPIELLQLARAITGSADTTLTHDECLIQLPAFIEAEVSDRSAAQLYPRVKRHLDLCAACQAEYVAALDIALLEARAELPDLDQVPAPDLSFLSAPAKSTPWLTRVRDRLADGLWALEFVFDSNYLREKVWPSALQLQMRSEAAFNLAAVEQVLLIDRAALSDQQINLEIRVAQSAPNAEFLTLYLDLVSSTSVPAHLSAQISFAGQNYRVSFNAEGQALLTNISAIDLRAALSADPHAVKIVIEAHDDDDYPIAH